jgi:hypothetical protein
VAGGTYELAKGVTPKFGTASGNTKVNNCVARLYDNASLSFSATINLTAGDQKKYSDFNILVNGSRYATLAGTMSATLSVKYVGDATWYSVWTESVSSGNGGVFGGEYKGDTGTYSKQSAAWRQVAVSDGEGYAKTVSSLTVGGNGSSYMYEFATPIALDSSKVLESFKMDSTTYNKSRVNDFVLYAASATPASSGPGGTDDDSDGIPNDWETLYFGGATNANPNAPAANGVNTVMETYVAGLNPTNPASVFLIANFRSLTSGSILQWSAVSGLVYSVYGTTNLFNQFQPLETNILWPQNSWTDAVHGAEIKNFYRIKVQLDQ